MTVDSGGADGCASSGNQNDHKSLHHWVYVAGWCILSGVINFAFLWPERHFFGLLALAASLSLPLSYELTVRGVPPWGTAGAVTTTFVAALVAYVIIGPGPPPETPTHGWLQAAKEPSAKTACPDRPWGWASNLEVAGRQVVVALGHSGAWIPSYGAANDAKWPTTKHTILRIGRCDVLTIDRRESGTLVDADIFNSDGSLVARIVDNEIHLVPAQYSYSERSDDRSTLVVHDKKGAELFWLRFLNPRSIKIRGYFACEGSSAVRVTDEAIIVGNAIAKDFCGMSYAGKGAAISAP